MVKKANKNNILAVLLLIGMYCATVVAVISISRIIITHTMCRKEVIEAERYADQLEKYDNEKVNGAAILALIHYLDEYGKGSIPVTVINAESINTYVNYIPIVIDKTSENYIAPTDKYVGSVTKNNAGIITEITFEIVDAAEDDYANRDVY